MISQIITGIRLNKVKRLSPIWLCIVIRLATTQDISQGIAIVSYSCCNHLLFWGTCPGMLASEDMWDFNTWVMDKVWCGCWHLINVHVCLISRYAHFSIIYNIKFHHNNRSFVFLCDKLQWTIKVIIIKRKHVFNWLLQILYAPLVLLVRLLVITTAKLSVLL